MADTKLIADGGSITVWFALPNAFADWKKPTVAELNNALDITESMAWENFSFGAQASNQNSDPGMKDRGNAQARGFSQFGGTISFFYPFDWTDDSNVLLTTFEALEEQYTLGYIIVRVDGQKTTGGAVDVDKPAVEGDFVSIYRVISDGWADAVTGELSFKYSITFQPQGDLWINAYVGATADVITPAPVGAADYTVGGKTALTTHLNGRYLYSHPTEYDGYPGWFQWESDNPAVATVDRNGVVVGVSAGTANITATWPPTGDTSTPLEVTVA